MKIGTLGRVDFFQVGLENSIYKNSECKSQVKKAILIPNIFFMGAKWFFLYLVARGRQNFRFLADLISFSSEGRLVHLLPWSHQ